MTVDSLISRRCAERISLRDNIPTTLPAFPRVITGKASHALLHHVIPGFLQRVVVVNDHGRTFDEFLDFQVRRQRQIQKVSTGQHTDEPSLVVNDWKSLVKCFRRSQLQPIANFLHGVFGIQSNDVCRRYISNIHLIQKIRGKLGGNPNAAPRYLLVMIVLLTNNHETK